MKGWGAGEADSSTAVPERFREVDYPLRSVDTVDT